jgi:hypothetical protein
MSIKAVGNGATATLAVAAEEPAIAALTAPIAGIVFSQDNPDPGANIYETFRGAYDAVHSIKAPGPRYFFFHNQFGPVNTATLPFPNNACEIPAGPTVAAALAYVADNGGGDSEIQGGDFVAAGWNPEGGELVVIKDAPVNGSATKFYVTKEATDQALVLDGVVLSDEAAVASRAILAWDFRGIKIMDLDPGNGRTDVVALEGAMAIGFDELENHKGGFPFNLYNLSTEPFAMFPDQTSGILSLEFFEFGLFASYFLALGGNGAGFGFSTGGTYPERVSPGPLIKFPSVGGFAQLNVLVLLGGKLPGNMYSGDAFLTQLNYQSPQQTQYLPENQPALLNIFTAVGADPVEFVRSSHAARLVGGLAQLKADNLTFISSASSGNGLPQIQGPDWFASGFLNGNYGIRVIGSASNDGKYGVAFVGPANTLNLVPTFVGAPDLVDEGPVAASVQSAIVPNMFMAGLVDAETYALESASLRVGECIELKAAAVGGVAAAITIRALTAAESPTGVAETIDGAATTTIPIGDSAITVRSDGKQWLIVNRL